MELINNEPSIGNQFRVILAQFGKHTGETKTIIEKMWNNPKIRA